jgi:glutamine synthetase
LQPTKYSLYLQPSNHEIHLEMNTETYLNKNHIVATLNKPARDFTKEDIIKYIVDNGIEMINFMYPAEDGRLKTLNFVINNYDYLETILSTGERVDGSSLFSYIEAGNSDLYVIPRFRTAFRDPFAEIPTVTMLCSFFDKDGKQLDLAPEHILAKACDEFRKSTGMQFEAMGELEFYVIAPDTGTFPATDQKGYHESGPFAKFNDFRTKCMSYIAQAGGTIKYGHSEVGNFTINGVNYEQNEIEFLPIRAEEAADQLSIAKWVIRNLAHRYDLNVTFAPKITTGKAGSGLHIHMRVTRDGQNMMLNADRTLSETARKAIAGMMETADAITAFGNINPTSYFRLVPHQEAPTNICWGDRNRSVLVRVPLGWTSNTDMCAAANPGSCGGDAFAASSRKQTVEIRSADGSADVYLLIAGLAVACRHGFEMANALEIAEKTYVDVDIHKPENAAKLNGLRQLPTSCEESAKCLDAKRAIFEDKGVFPAAAIDGIIRRLNSYDEANIIAEAKSSPVKMAQLVERFFHCG